MTDLVEPTPSLPRKRRREACQTGWMRTLMEHIVTGSSPGVFWTTYKRLGGRLMRESDKLRPNPTTPDQIRFVNRLCEGFPTVRTIHDEHVEFNGELTTGSL